MAIKLRSKNPYWAKFSVYQTFESRKDLHAHVKQFNKMYTLTPSVKAVLNTLKLYSSKTFFGVCWPYKEEIAKKAKVSISSVTRALKELKEIGILTVHENMHTMRGGQTHNVYVINPTFDGYSEEIEQVNDSPNELAGTTSEEPSNLDAASDSAVESETHKNLNTNLNKKSLNHLSIKKNDELKFIPNEFIDLMEPFYANQPDIIRDRWKTVCVAAKKSCCGLKNASFDTIGQAWTDVVKLYKRGKIKNDSDKGIGGYFYTVLSDYLLNAYLRSFV